MKFTEKFTKANGDSIFLIKGNVDGNELWHIIDVKKSKLPLLKKQIDDEATVELKDYGNIIRSGWGDQPDQETMEWLRKTLL